MVEAESRDSGEEVWGGRRAERERVRESMLLGLKMEEGVMSHTIGGLSKLKSWGTDSSLEPLPKIQTLMLKLLPSLTLIN